MIKLKARILAYWIEYHWWMVMRYRQIMGLLYRMEKKLNSPGMLWLNKKISKHALTIMKAEQHYEKQFYPAVGGVL